MLDQIHWTATAVYLLDLCIRIGLSVRVIKRRLPVGVALAWLSVILILPLARAVPRGCIGRTWVAFKGMAGWRLRASPRH
jgi:cardiolipin synthase